MIFFRWHLGLPYARPPKKSFILRAKSASIATRLYPTILDGYDMAYGNLPKVTLLDVETERDQDGSTKKSENLSLFLCPIAIMF